MNQKKCVIVSPLGGEDVTNQVFEDVKTALDTLVSRHGSFFGRSKDLARLTVESGSLPKYGLQFTLQNDTGLKATFFVVDAIINTK